MVAFIKVIEHFDIDTIHDITNTRNTQPKKLTVQMFSI